jgi:hypothetical protein
MNAPGDTRMRCLFSIPVIALCAFLAGACSGDASKGKKAKPGSMGGCAYDTISLGIEDRAGCSGGGSHIRISILSVDRVGDDIYSGAAAEVLSIIDSLGVKVCGKINLAVLSEGPCWPRHRIDIRLERGAERMLPEIRSILSGRSIAGFAPAAKRPDEYGSFFIQAAVGSSDRWTVWFR